MHETLRHNNFNLLRLLLALLVLLSHSAELADGNRSREILTQLFHTLSFGEFSVDGFFLLSGFLIAQSWVSTPVLGVFLQKRVLRIFPGFLAASLICGLVVGPLAADAGYLGRLAPATVLRDMLLLQAPSVTGVFSGQPHPVLNGSMWTISLEFFCYLSVAGLGMIGAVRRRPVWLALAVTSVGIAFAQRAGLLQLATPAVLDWADGLVRLIAFFLAGGAFYLYREPLRGRWPWVLAALAITGAAMCSWRLVELALATSGGYALLRLALQPIRSCFSGISRTARRGSRSSFARCVVWHWARLAGMRLNSRRCVGARAAWQFA